jgi:hypothetical protein
VHSAHSSIPHNHFTALFIYILYILYIYITLLYSRVYSIVFLSIVPPKTQPFGYENVYNFFSVFPLNLFFFFVSPVVGFVVVVQMMD